MKRLFLFILIIAASVWLGIQIKQDPGYVLLASQHWTVEMPLWFGALALLLSILLLYGLVKSTIALIALPITLRTWIKRRRLQKNYRLTQRGLLALAEGKLSLAERTLLSAKVKEASPLVNYLAAAIAAQAIGATDRCDNYLKKAMQTSPTTHLAIDLVQIRLWIARKEFTPALATLQRLSTKYPKHVGVLRLLGEIYLQLQQWNELEKLLPLLRKRHCLSAQDIYHLEENTYQGLLMQASDVASIQQIWQRTSRELRRNIKVISAYVRALIGQQAGSMAMTLLQDQLKIRHDPQLIRLYGIAAPKPSDQQLNFAERLLNSHSQDPDLLLCLGQICLRKQLWGKARGYLNSCIEVTQIPDAYFELGLLMEQLNDHLAAKDYYQKGLQFYQLQTSRV